MIGCRCRGIPFPLQDGGFLWQNRGYGLCCANWFPVGRIGGIPWKRCPEIGWKVWQSSRSVSVKNFDRHIVGRLDTAIVDLNISAVDIPALRVAMCKFTLKCSVVHISYIH